MSTNVFVKSGRVTDMENSATGITSVTTGPWIYKDAPKGAFQIVLTGTGAVTATVAIELSNDGTNALATPLATVSLSGTTTVSDGFQSDASWKYVRLNVTALTGTGAAVRGYMSV